MAEYTRSAVNVAVRAVCISSMAGNGEIDVRKTGDSVLSLLALFGNAVEPYSSKRVPEKKGVGYAKYFDLLDRMEAESAEKNGRQSGTRTD